MTENEVRSLFTLAGLEVLRLWKLPNGEEAQRTAREERTVSKDEIGWVIERDIHSQLHYWTGRPTDNPSAWSPKHEDALRMARREDGYLMLTYHCDGIGRVVEHLWANR